VGHPLRGRTLCVDPGGGGLRRDRRVQVVLPDGSRALLPIVWTNLASPSVADVDGAPRPRFTREGLRRLLRLAHAMASKHGDPLGPA
jgi:hypothetical protein